MTNEGGDIHAYRSECPIRMIKGLIIYRDNQLSEVESKENQLWGLANMYEFAVVEEAIRSSRNSRKAEIEE